MQAFSDSEPPLLDPPKDQQPLPDQHKDQQLLLDQLKDQPHTDQHKDQLPLTVQLSDQLAEFFLISSSTNLPLQDQQPPIDHIEADMLEVWSPDLKADQPLPSDQHSDQLAEFFLISSSTNLPLQDQQPPIAHIEADMLEVW